MHGRSVTHEYPTLVWSSPLKPSDLELTCSSEYSFGLDMKDLRFCHVLIENEYLLRWDYVLDSGTGKDELLISLESFNVQPPF